MSATEVPVQETNFDAEITEMVTGRVIDILPRLSSKDEYVFLRPTAPETVRSGKEGLAADCPCGPVSRKLMYNAIRTFFYAVSMHACAMPIIYACIVLSIGVSFRLFDNDSMHNAKMEQDANNSLMSIMLIICMTRLLSQGL